MNTIYANCKKMLYRTDSCKGVSGKCARTDGGSKVMSGGSSAVERQPSKLGVEGSTPSPRSKPPSAAKPKAKKSTAARMDVPGKTTVRNDALAQIGTTPPVKSAQPTVSQEAGFASTGDSVRKRVPDPNTAADTQAPPVDKSKRVDTRKGDRHRADYWKTYQRPDRAAKAAKEPK